MFLRNYSAYDGSNSGAYQPDDSGGGGGTGEGGNTTDLTNLENKVTEMNENLVKIENKIPSKEDVQNAVSQGNKDYWGEPNEEQIKQEQEKNIDEIKGQLETSLENNEILGALETAENRFIEILQGKPRRF